MPVLNQWTVGGGGGGGGPATSISDFIATEADYRAALAEDKTISVAQSARLRQNLSRYIASSGAPNPLTVSRTPPRRPIFSLIKQSADTDTLSDIVNSDGSITLAERGTIYRRALQRFEPGADPLNVVMEASWKQNAPGTDAQWGMIYSNGVMTGYTASNVSSDQRSFARGGFSVFIWLGTADTIRLDPKKQLGNSSDETFDGTEVTWTIPDSFEASSGISDVAVGSSNAGQLVIDLAASGANDWTWINSTATNVADADEVSVYIFYNQESGRWDFYLGKLGYEVLVGSLAFDTRADDPFSLNPDGTAFDNPPGPYYIFKSHVNDTDTNFLVTKFGVTPRTNVLELEPGKILGLAKAARASSDRGSPIGVSTSDENVLTLLPALNPYNILQAIDNTRGSADRGKVLIVGSANENTIEFAAASSAISDASILNQAQTVRTAADRNKVIGTISTNQNVLGLLSVLRSDRDILDDIQSSRAAADRGKSVVVKSDDQNALELVDLLTAQAVLDTIQSPRTNADRGKTVIVSPTNRNAFALTSTPEHGRPTVSNAVTAKGTAANTITLGATHLGKIVSQSIYYATAGQTANLERTIQFPNANLGAVGDRIFLLAMVNTGRRGQSAGSTQYTNHVVLTIASGTNPPHIYMVDELGDKDDLHTRTSRKMILCMDQVVASSTDPTQNGYYRHYYTLVKTTAPAAGDKGRWDLLFGWHW